MTDKSVAQDCGESFNAAENRSKPDRLSEIRSEIPPHRVVQREVIDWANSLNGKPPIGEDLSRLVQTLASAVEADRHLPAVAQGAVMSRDEAIAAVYRVVESHPKYALTQINDFLAGEIVDALAAQPPAAPIETADLELPAPGAPLNKGNAHQRPGIRGDADAPRRDCVCGPAGPHFHSSAAT
jgi:hypothetical protein